jgi:hypothetical protein
MGHTYEANKPAEFPNYDDDYDTGLGKIWLDIRVQEWKGGASIANPKSSFLVPPSLETSIFPTEENGKLGFKVDGQYEVWYAQFDLLNSRVRDRVESLSSTWVWEYSWSQKTGFDFSSFYQIGGNRKAKQRVNLELIQQFQNGKYPAYFGMQIALMGPDTTVTGRVDTLSIPVVGGAESQSGSEANTYKGSIIPFTCKVGLYWGKSFPAPVALPEDSLLTYTVRFNVGKSDVSMKVVDPKTHASTDEDSLLRSWMERFKETKHKNVLALLEQGKVPVWIYGQTSRPGERINYELSDRRAQSIKVKLKKFFGDSSDVRAAGRGTRPEAGPGLDVNEQIAVIEIRKKELRQALEQ